MYILLRGRGVLTLLGIAIGLAQPVSASVLPSGVDLWFSTSTPTIAFKGGIKYLGPGAVLSTTGQVVATNKQLLSAFQPRLSMPMDRGLDALAIIGTNTDKTIVFSTNRSFYSNTLKRTISDGDLITNKGELIATNADLLAAFSPKGSNFGLDAAFVRSTTGTSGAEIWFSTDRSFYSNTLSTWVGAGDIVSNRGTIVAKSSDLLAAFSPKGDASSIGIDSLFVRQDGDVQTFWFSTNKDFYSNTLKRNISAADLISSDGTVVMTQKDFTKDFGFVYPICGTLQLDAATFSIPSLPPDRPPPKTPEPMSLSLLLVSLLGLSRRRRSTGQ